MLAPAYSSARFAIAAVNVIFALYFAIRIKLSMLADSSVSWRNVAVTHLPPSFKDVGGEANRKQVGI